MASFTANNRFFLLGFLIWVLVLGMLGLTPVHAQDENLVTQAHIKQWQEEISHARLALDRDFKHSNVKDTEKRLKNVFKDAKDALEEARKQLDSTREQMAELKGTDETDEDSDKDKDKDKDKEEEEKEAESDEDAGLTQLRRQLQRRMIRHNSDMTRIKLIVSQAGDTLRDISNWRQRQVLETFLYSNPMPLKTEVWKSALKDGKKLAHEMVRSPIEWWQEHKEEGKRQIDWTWFLPLAVLLLGVPFRRWILMRFGRDPEEPEPTYARRIIKCSFDGLANALIPVAMIVLTMAILAWKGVLTGLFGHLLYAISAIISAFIVLFGLARTALSPRLVQWRIVAVEPAYTGRLLYAIGITLGLMALVLILLITAQSADFLTSEMESFVFLIQGTCTALAMAWVLTPQYWAESITASQELGTAEEHADAIEDEEEKQQAQDSQSGQSTQSQSDRSGQSTQKENDNKVLSSTFRERLLRFLRVLVLLTPVPALLGYGRLTYYLQSRAVATAAIIGIGILLNLVLQEALEQTLVGKRRRRRERQNGQHDPEEYDTDIRIMVYWAGLAINLLLMLPGISLLLWIYGIPLITLRIWAYELLSGIAIGSIKISLIDILTAVLVLIAGIFSTSLVRRWMTHHLLPNTRLDMGARNSIAAGTSYLGIGLAGLLAIVTLGIDFSNLAVVAGALSVGIGFGLQNVVQNFAAGLLLLIERPIKLGDWVHVSGTEGSVKRISVRFTEVETFDQASVFVPNSDLISSHVTNWTHKNRKARLTLPVQVAYGSDPKKVEEVLLQCANKQQHVLWYPQSYVWFRGFANGVLNFELRVYISNSDYWIDVDHNLYIAIDAALQEAGIVVPLPQRELYIEKGAPGHARSRLEEDVSEEEDDQNSAAPHKAEMSDNAAEDSDSDAEGDADGDGGGGAEGGDPN